MRRQVKNLFVTPLWIYQIGDRFLNKKLMVDSLQYQSGEQNFLDLSGDGISELKKLVIDAVNEISTENNWQYDELKIRSRLNPINPKEYDTPHHHPDADMLGIYYLYTPANSGDIQFIDARGSVSNIWKDPNIDIDGISRDGRVSVKITPEAGMLLFFPNYLIHAVEPNYANDTRLSIVFDFKFVKESM